MRDFDWFDELYAVVKDDGSFAGRPCISWEEARELQAQHEGSKIFELKYDNSNFEDLTQDGFVETNEPWRIAYNQFEANP